MPVFVDQCDTVVGHYLAELQKDVSWYCKKFDYRYEKKSWGNSKDAVERTVNKVRGWSVGKEPNE